MVIQTLSPVAQYLELWAIWVWRNCIFMYIHIFAYNTESSTFWVGKHVCVSLLLLICGLTLLLAAGEKREKKKGQLYLLIFPFAQRSMICLHSKVKPTWNSSSSSISVSKGANIDRSTNKSQISDFFSHTWRQIFPTPPPGSGVPFTWIWSILQYACCSLAFLRIYQLALGWRFWVTGTEDNLTLKKNHN